MDRGLELAVKAAGGRAALARRLGLSKQAVTRWARVPAGRVVAVAKVTRVYAEVLRPDLFGAVVRRVRRASRVAV